MQEVSEPVLSLLSQRHTEIAILVALGLSDKQIANRLNLSSQTVRNHLAIIRQRTGCPTRVHLARRVWEQAAAMGFTIEQMATVVEHLPNEELTSMN